MEGRGDQALRPKNDRGGVMRNVKQTGRPGLKFTFTGSHSDDTLENIAVEIHSKAGFNYKADENCS